MTHESNPGPRTISEFLRLNTIDRRDFLIAMQRSLVGASAFGLFACAAGSSDSDGSGTPGGGSPSGPGSGSITFPPGFTAKLTGLTVTSGRGSASVNSSMQFAASADPSIPSLVHVQDSTGAVIFSGFVDPTSDSNILGATSTAIALLYFALDAYSLPPGNNAAILALIAADPNTATLANAISQRMLSNTYALDQSDAAITTALATAFTAITGASGSGRRSTPARTPAFDSGPAELAISGGLQSGFNVNVDPTGATTSYTGQNTFRRYATMYAYETSTTDGSGNVTTLPAALSVATPLDVESTQRLNLATALKDIFTTTTPLSPVTSDAVTLALPTDAEKATFDIIVLGSSGNATEPAFFSQSAYAGEVTAWRAQVQRLNLRTSIGDIFLGMILNMIGVTSITALPVDIDTAVASLEAIGDAAWQVAIADAAAGTRMMAPVNYAARILLNGSSFPSTSSAWAQEVFETCETLIKTGNAASAAAISEATFTTSLAVGLRVIAGAISGASIVLGTGDLAAVIHDVTVADQGDVWSAILGVPALHIAPTSVTITPGSSTPQQFTVSLPPGTTGTYVWNWTLTGGATAQITDEQGNQGTALTRISATSVFLITTTNDIHPMTLTVEGFFVESGGTQDSIGKATASIAVNASTNFAVRTWTESINEDVFSDPTAADQFATVVGFFTFPTTPGVTTYKIVTLQDNVFTLSASDIAGLPVANDQLGFPDVPAGSGSGPAWGSFVQLGGGMIGFAFTTYGIFPGPYTQYVTPDGIQVTAAGQGYVFWRYYTADGENSQSPGSYIPISDAEIADTLTYMQTIMLNEMISVGPPVLTMT